MPKKNNPPAWNLHPGEILREDFLKPLHMTPYRLAGHLRVPPPRINDIVLERRGLTADTAVRLARFFGTSPEFWDARPSLLRGSRGRTPPRPRTPAHQAPRSRLSPWTATL